MNTRYLSAVLLALLGVSGTLAAQVTITRPGRGVITLAGDPDRPRLGISIEPTGAKDTLGVLVASVTKDSPADKAGIKEGDRLVAINGVNLRLAPADAEDEEMQGVVSRRLTRELSRHKAGDEVELRLVRDGRTQTLRVKTTAASELAPATATWVRGGGASAERASLGIGLGATGSKRDTLGILVASLAVDGPAEKAGLEEGDRIASVNGIDLRVQREDVGDWSASTAKVNRLNRELEKVKAGDEVELRVYRAGQPRTVKVKTVAARELRSSRRGMFMVGDGPAMRSFDFGDLPVPPVPPLPPVPRAPGAAPVPPTPPVAPVPPEAPLMFWFGDDEDDAVRLRISPRMRMEVREQTREALRRALELAPRLRQRIRVEADGLGVIDDVSGVEQPAPTSPEADARVA